jgi:hypothetical protein
MSVRLAEEIDLRAHLGDGSTLAADALFLATGKHDLRGLPRPRAAAFKHPVVGLRAALLPSNSLLEALRGQVELHLFDDGYAGLLVQEDDSINLCLSVSAERLKSAGGVGPLLGELASESPRLGERLAHAPDASRWDAIAGVPYGWRAVEGRAGLFRLGDQAAVIASLAGDGVAIALTSGIEAASAYLEGGPGAASSYQSRFSAHTARPLMIAGLLRSAAENQLSRKLLLGAARTAPGLAALAARLTRV